MPIDSRFTVPIPECSIHKWLFEDSFRPLSDRKLFLDADRPESHFVTQSDYRLLSKRLAAALQQNGLRPGDRVLLYSGNNIFFPAVFMGVLMSGGIFTGANPGYTARELAYQLKDSGASFLLAAHSNLDTALEAAALIGLPLSRTFVFDSTIPGSSQPECPATKGTRHWTELLVSAEQGEKFDWWEPENPRDALACLNYSSGTTGVPKGVEITHHSFVANCVGVIRMAEVQSDYAAVLKRAVGLAMLPMFHAYGQTYFIANQPKQGIPVYIMPRFDFLKMLQHIQRYRVTSITAVPPIIVGLAKHPAVPQFDLSSVETVGSGAAPLAAETARGTEARLGVGVPVLQGWGMTELTCTAMSWDLARADRDGGIGEVAPNCRAKLVSAADGRSEVTTPGRRGEIWMAGPIVMRGYWRNPAATRAAVAVDADGTRWLRTGDVGYFDRRGPGAIWYVVDRIKELIKVRGHQVAPAELEGLLLERPDVADAGVVGVVVDGEEAPRAYVVPKPDAGAPSEEEIARWVARRVAKHKRLAGGVKFVSEIPKNPSGKILRKHLRELAAKEVGDRKKADSKI